MVSNPMDSLGEAVLCRQGSSGPCLVSSMLFIGSHNKMSNDICV